MRVCNAAGRKASLMLGRSGQAGLQLEVAKVIVTAARQVVLDHSAGLLLCGIAAGGCYILTAARREELGCRSYRRDS